MALTVDDTDFPLLRIVFAGSPSDDDVRAYFEAYDRVLARRQRYALLFDASRAEPSPTLQRRKAEFLKQRASVLGALCLGGAYVITSPVVRGALSAVFWIQPLPYAHVVVPTVAEGEAWCRRRLDDAGLTKA